MVTGVNPRSRPLLPTHVGAAHPLASAAVDSRTPSRAPDLATRVSHAPTVAPRRRSHPSPAHAIVEMGDWSEIDLSDPTGAASTANLFQRGDFVMADPSASRPQPSPARLPPELLLAILGHEGGDPPARHAQALALASMDKSTHASLRGEVERLTLMSRATAVRDGAELARFLQEVDALEPHRRGPVVEALCRTALAHVVPRLPRGSSHELRDAWRRMQSDSEPTAWESVREFALRSVRPDRADAITAALAAVGAGVGIATGAAMSTVAGSTAGAATGVAVGLASGSTLGAVANRRKSRAMRTPSALQAMLTKHLLPMCDSERRDMSERCIAAARATLPAAGQARAAAALCRLDHGNEGRSVVTDFAMACLQDSEPLPDALRAELLDAVLCHPSLPADTFATLLPMLEALPPKMSAGPWANAWLHLVESQDRATISRLAAPGGPLDELPKTQLARTLLPMLVAGPLFDRHHDLDTLRTGFFRLWNTLPTREQRAIDLMPVQPSRIQLAEALEVTLTKHHKPMRLSEFENIAHIVGSLCRNPHSRTLACNDAETVDMGFARHKLVAALARKVKLLPPSDRAAGIDIVAASLGGIATDQRHAVLGQLLFVFAARPEIGGVPESDLPHALRRVIDEASDFATLKTDMPDRLESALRTRYGTDDGGPEPSPQLDRILQGGRR